MKEMISRGTSNYWKGIAIIGVICCHIIFRTNNSLLGSVFHSLVSQGEFGVNIFFFLSIFGLCFSFEKNGIMTFYGKRFCRLYPAYFFFILYVLFFLKGGDKLFYHLIYSVTGRGTICCDFYDALYEWYIPSLTIIYLLFPILFYGIRTLVEMLDKTKETFKIVFWSMALFFCVYPLYYLLLNVIHPYLLGRFNAILLGFLCFFYRRNSKLLNSIFVFSIIMSLLSYHDCKFHFVVPAIIYFSSILEVPLFLKKPFMFLGKHSFELYLGQYIGIQTLFLSLNNNYAIDLCVGLLVSAIFAALFFFIQHYFWLVITYIRK